MSLIARSFGGVFRSARAVLIAALVVAPAAAMVAGCQDMSARDYYIFGRPSTSQTTKAPEAPAPAAPTETPAPLTPAPAPPSAEAAPAAPTEARPVVALLVPLSGQSSALGRALFDAASLALFDVGDDAFTLLPRDTGGTPDGAAAAAQSALDAGARLIIGPLFGAEVPAVAAVARPAGVNVVTFSNDPAVAGSGVFLLGLTPQGQIQRVASFARSRGLQNYAALLPNNNFGAAVEDALRSTASAVGAQVVTVERYDPASGDATPVVKRLAAYQASSAPAAAPAGSTDAMAAPARSGFDAILLPDFGDRLLSIAPLLPYYDIDPGQVRFLGSAFWEDPRVTREPALIGAWFPAPPPAARADFIRRFRSVYGQPPPRIATLAYDATALAAVLARGAEGPDFSADALANPNGFAGADGIFRFRSDGTAERGLAVLEVQRDGFKVVSPAPEDFRELTR